MGGGREGGNTIVGVGCYAGCANTVIGQCQGHRRPCGLFYCAEHNVDRLCNECGSDLYRYHQAEARYPQYRAASLRMLSVDQSRGSWRTSTVTSAVFFVIVVGVAMSGVLPDQVPGALAPLLAVVLGAVAAGSAYLWWRTGERLNRLRRRFDAEPGFEQFAVLWERQWPERASEEQEARNRQRLVELIAAALVIPNGQAEGQPVEASGE